MVCKTRRIKGFRQHLQTLHLIAGPTKTKTGEEITRRTQRVILKGKNKSPEGSFKCDSVARSSAVSRRGGFRSGGKSPFPSLMSFPLVSMVISCKSRYWVLQKETKRTGRTLPRSSTKTSLMLSFSPFVTWVTSAEIQPCSLSVNHTLVPLL